MNYLVHLLIYFDIYVIVALSLNLVVGYCGMLTLAHAGYYAIGGYAYALLALAACRTLGFQSNHKPGNAFFCTILRHSGPKSARLRAISRSMDAIRPCALDSMRDRPASTRGGHSPGRATGTGESPSLI